MFSMFLGICLILVSSQTCNQITAQVNNFNVTSNNYTFIYNKMFNSISGQAVLVKPSSSWVTSIPGASWIWDSTVNNLKDQTVYFKVAFYIPGVPTNGKIVITADDNFNVTVNGFDAKCSGQSTYKNKIGVTCDILNYVITGENTAMITVYNKDGPSGLLYSMGFVYKVRMC